MKYNLKQLGLIAANRFYCKIFGKPELSMYPRTYGDDEVSKIVADALDSNKPFMLSRFGAVEISAVYNYIGVSSQKHSVFDYIRGKAPQWWWNEGIRRCMKDNAGFFPNTDDNLMKFGKLMLESMQQIDILTSWQDRETFGSLAKACG